MNTPAKVGGAAEQAAGDGSQDAAADGDHGDTVGDFGGGDFGSGDFEI